LRPDWCPPEAWQSKPIPESYFGKTRYAFQLCANPTKKIASKADGTVTKNGRRVPLGKREELVDWIKRKGEQGGFLVNEGTLRTFSRRREYFVKKGRPGLHSAVEFQGVLTVTDPARFHETFTRGIGSAKAFGFGLLVIARI
jgi:CRISPR system Cascade subunit CasE